MRRPHIAVKSSPTSLQLEKHPHSNEDPVQPKINKQIRSYGLGTTRITSTEPYIALTPRSDPMRQVPISLFCRRGN